MIDIVYQRPDKSLWTYIDNMPYGVYQESSIYDEIIKHITEHPEALIPEPTPPEPTAEEKATFARRQRDALLAACDWTQVADAPVDQAAWKVYRQALRDWPSTKGFPDISTMPEAPKK